MIASASTCTWPAVRSAARNPFSSATASDYEFIEIHNITSQPYNLSGASFAQRTVDGDLDPAALVELMGRDKKAYDGLTFVLDGPRGPEIVTEVAARQVLAALERVRP